MRPKQLEYGHEHQHVYEHGDDPHDDGAAADDNGAGTRATRTRRRRRSPDEVSRPTASPGYLAAPWKDAV